MLTFIGLTIAVLLIRVIWRLIVHKGGEIGTDEPVVALLLMLMGIAIGLISFFTLSRYTLNMALDLANIDYVLGMKEMWLLFFVDFILGRVDVKALRKD